MQKQELEVFESAVQVIENDYIAIKPCCEFFEIDYRKQLARIKTDIVTSQLCSKQIIVAADGKQREMYSLPKSGFLRWIYTLNAGSIAGKNGQKFNSFVVLLHEYLFGDTSPARLIQQKQDRLYEIRAESQKLAGKIEAMKAEVKDLKIQKQEIDKQFDELFISNALQTKLELN